MKKGIFNEENWECIYSPVDASSFLQTNIFTCPICKRRIIRKFRFDYFISIYDNNGRWVNSGKNKLFLITEKNPLLFGIKNLSLHNHNELNCQNCGFPNLKGYTICPNCKKHIICR